MHDEHPGGEKVDWSEDNGEEAYEEFKKRKSVKRKKAAASTRKAKAVEKEGITGKKRKTLNVDKKAKGKNERQWDDESDDDHLMEYTLPGLSEGQKSTV